MAAPYRTVLVKAKISRGGFSNERTYSIRAKDGMDFIGLAPWIYCFDTRNSRIQTEPVDDQSISGFVQARIISGPIAGPFKLSLPGGDVCVVEKSEIIEDPTIPAPPENYARVPV